MSAHSADEAFAARQIRALLRAAAEGDAGKVAALLESDPGLANAKGMHPYWGGEPHAIHVAAEWGRVDVVRELLNKGADPNVRDASYSGWSPLHLALHHDRDEVVRILLAHGVSPDIWAASAMGDAARVVEILATDPALVHAQGPNDATPLHFAATAEVADTLIRAGADLSAKDCHGKTPARFIAGYGARRRAAAERVLASSGERDAFLACALGDAGRVADFINQDPAAVHLRRSAQDRETLLHVASEHGHPEIVEFLLGRGADITARAGGGVTALHLATRKGHISLVELLLKEGAEVNPVEEFHHSTPLGWAIFHEQPEVARVLKAHGGQE